MLFADILSVAAQAGGAFSPASLNPSVWYDPSDLATVWEDSARTTPASVNGVVGALDDKSGNGRHATQATTANKPILRLTSGLYYLEFDGTDDFLSTAAIDFSGADQVTAVAGARKLSDAAQATLFELRANGTTTGGFGILAPSGATASYRFISTGSQASLAIYTDASVAAPHSAVLTGQGEISADLCTLRINGVERATSATDQELSGAQPGYANDVIYIGRRAGTSNPFNGRLHGLIILGRLLTAPELTNTEAWMSAKALP